ncbi:MAG: type II toxin-antitoxin system HicB family antitoxin [Alphaproteobacteria bacterium]|nr:type II toxin-antitoxin system HicB family antitoxin [Alphaproteobacteria bacterium]
MAQVHYVAVIERSDDGYCVFFPDLPGCTSAGDTIEQAIRNAEEAARDHAALTIEAGERLPAPRPADTIPTDPEVAEVARFLVRVELPGRAERVNVTIDSGLLDRIDRAARERGMSRSGLLAEAARRFIDAA